MPLACKAAARSEKGKPDPDTSVGSTLASLILAAMHDAPQGPSNISTVPRSPQLMVAGAVAAVAAVQQASSIEQALVEGAAASKAGCRHARPVLLLLLLEAQLVLTRQGSVQAARRQVQALTAAR